jgi:hypothetical protein
MKPTDPIAALAMALAVMTPVERLKAETVVLTNAIAQIESGCDYKAVGDKGAAVGAWQMHYAAWITANQWRKANGLTTIPRKAWQVPANQREVAIAYVSWCREKLIAAGVKDPTPEQIYIAYAWGMGNLSDVGMDFAKAPSAKRNAAERVGNIYRGLIK